VRALSLLATPTFWQFAGLLALLVSSFAFDQSHRRGRLPFRPGTSEAAAYRFMLGTAPAVMTLACD